MFCSFPAFHLFKGRVNRRKPMLGDGIRCGRMLKYAVTVGEQLSQVPGKQMGGMSREKTLPRENRDH